MAGDKMEKKGGRGTDVRHASRRTPYPRATVVTAGGNRTDDSLFDNLCCFELCYFEISRCFHFSAMGMNTSWDTSSGKNNKPSVMTVALS